MKISKVKDWLERTFWTFANTLVGLLIADNVIGSFNIDLIHKIEGAALAAALTTIKVIVAQRVGSNSDGAAIPGGIRKGGLVMAKGKGKPGQGKKVPMGGMKGNPKIKGGGGM